MTTATELQDNRIRRAFLLAYRYHEHQRYGDDPYVIHLFDTYRVLVEFNHTEPTILAAALLHDIIEDTPALYHTVKDAVGFDVAEIVFACSDWPGRNRTERRIRTLAHFKQHTEQQAHDALKVKLADWIANIRDGLRSDTGKLSMYRKDWPDFSPLRELYRSEKLEPMWRCIEEMLWPDR